MKRALVNVQVLLNGGPRDGEYRELRITNGDPLELRVNEEVPEPVSLLAPPRVVPRRSRIGLYGNPTFYSERRKPTRLEWLGWVS